MKIGDGDDPFLSLMGQTFTPADLQRMSLGTSPYMLEPMQPGREELLGHFDGLLEQLINARLEKERQACRDRFLGNLAATVDLKTGEPIQVRKLASFVTKLAGGELRWAVLNDGSAQLTCNFMGFGIGEWFDIPLGVGEPEDTEPYKREHGLHVLLGDGEITFDDDETFPVGDIAVPLNHGKPELFRMIYQ